jgi:Family of unknown function (DUF6011)
MKGRIHMVDLSTGAEIGRLDHHSPANFLPENYSFVGCFHNRFTFGLGRFNSWDKAAEDLLAKLASNTRPHGPGVTNCDHCGAAIAFVGVFQHKDGDYIAVGNICAENRFPLSNVEFDRLRKAHRLGSAARRAEAKFDEFKLAHPEVDWTAAEASTNNTIRYALSQGRKYGSLFDYRLQQIQATLVAEQAARAAQAAPAAPVQAPAPVSAEIAFLRAYTGTNSFLNSLKDQDAHGRTLSPKQLACVTDNLARAARATDPAAQAKAAANQQLVPGIYVAADRTIWKVQGNQAYKSGVKRAVAQKIPFDASQVRGAALYAKVWSAAAAPLTLDEVSDLSTSQGWVYVKGGIATLEIDHKMTLDEAKHFATLYSQCVWCGKALEVTESIARGIGPVCIKYLDTVSVQPHTHELAAS